MSGKVDLSTSNVFSDYLEDRKGRKQTSDPLQKIFDDRKNAPVNEEVVDQVVDGAYGTPDDLFSGLNPDAKA